METVRTFLQGKKTFLVAALMVLTAVLDWVNGAALFDTIQQILVALGLGTLRLGIMTETKSD